MLFLVTVPGGHIDRSFFFLSKYETTQCKNYFDTNLVIEIVIFMFCAILIMANGGHLGMTKYKNSKRLHTRNMLARS